jgi:hypothetical protein
MGSLKERIAAYVDASAKLIIQLRELDSLRERVKKAKRRYNATPRPLRRRPSSSRRTNPPRADWH